MKCFVTIEFTISIIYQQIRVFPEPISESQCSLKKNRLKTQFQCQ